MSNADNASLSSLLLESKVKLSLEAVIDIVKGVAAGPTPESYTGNQNAWLELISQDMPEILIERLHSELNKLINIDERSNNKTTSDTFIERLTSLRCEIKSHQISGFMVPLADEHQGEYVAKNAQRLAWLTGFTGSAGMAIIQRNKAVIFVDGRYTLQAQQQVNQDLFEISNLNNNSIDKWISGSLAPGEILGFDPWLHTSDAIVRMKKTTDKMGVKLTPTKNNP